MSDITLLTADKYLASPCALLPAPFAVCMGSRRGKRHLGGADGAPDMIPEGAYCRVYHPLGDMKRLEAKDCSARQLFLAEDAEDAALVDGFALRCGVTLSIPSLIKKPYFCERLCAAVHSRATGECLCVGIGGLDNKLHEAWFEHLLIPEGAMGGEASRLLINELLRRMSGMANFATACAPCGSAQERLLRKAGFTGGDIWY